MLCSQNKDLYTACENGDVVEVKKLLSLGGDINYHNEDSELCVIVVTHVVTGV